MDGAAFPAPTGGKTGGKEVMPAHPTSTGALHPAHSPCKQTGVPPGVYHVAGRICCFLASKVDSNPSTDISRIY